MHAHTDSLSLTHTYTDTHRHIHTHTDARTHIHTSLPGWLLQLQIIVSSSVAVLIILGNNLQLDLPS